MERSRVRALAGLMAVALLAGSMTACDSSSKRKKKRKRADRDDDRVVTQSDNRYSSPRPQSPTPAPRHDLRWAGEAGTYSVQLNIGQIRYDALAAVENISNAPVTLVTMTVVTSGSPAVVQVTDVGLVTLPGPGPGGVGLVDTFPPANAKNLKVVKAAGTRLLPVSSARTHYGLVFRIRAANPGLWKAPPIVVTYRSTGGVRSLNLPHNVTVCVAPEATAEC